MTIRLLACHVTVAVLALATSGRALEQPEAPACPHAQEERLVLAANETAPAPAATAAKGVTGQGDLQFKVYATSDMLPAAAKEVLVKAHGGLAVDRRPGHGELYFALPKAGIVKIGADLKSATLLDTAPEVRDTNQHNAHIWYAEDGEAFLTFPGNEANKVYTTDLSGKLLHTLERPQDVKFSEQAVIDYFANAENKFVPTDAEYLNGMYYISTGYSPLDYVLTAKVTSTKPVKLEWTALAFAGRGDGPGQLGTGHGITISDDKSLVCVADRKNSELDYFSPEGKYLRTAKVPQGALPCDSDTESQYTITGCLDGPDKAKGAPIYILENDQVVSTILIKDELGLPNFVHIHNATLVTMNDKLYLVALAWNPGDVVVLEQVK